MKRAPFDGFGEDGCGGSDGGGFGMGRRRNRRRGFGRGPCSSHALGALTLADVSPGTTCTIRRLHGHGPARQRLIDLGFQPGRAVKVLRNAPLNDPIEVQLGDTFIALRRREARHIAIDIPDLETNGDE